MNIGYARVSTGDQNLDLQRDASMTAGCEESKMFTDTLSRVKDGRSGLVQALEKAIHSPAGERDVRRPLTCRVGRYANRGYGWEKGLAVEGIDLIPERSPSRRSKTTERLSAFQVRT